MIRITICTPVWGRPKMTDAFLAHIRGHVPLAAKKGISLTVSITGSEREVTKNKVVKHGFLYTETPNKPLGAKFNLAVTRGVEVFQPDYIMILGSDTFFAPTIWDEYVALINDGNKYIGTTDLYMWDWDDGRAVYWGGYHGERFGEPIGPGRALHTSLIPKKGYLYDSELNKSLDASFTRGLLQRGVKAVTFESKKHLLVSCKQDINITSISNFNQEELEDVDAEIFSTIMGIK